MKDITVCITSLERIKHDVYMLSFDAPYLARAMHPGQFVEIKIDSPELSLRRPFCIHHVNGSVVHILFRIRGAGTRALAHMKKGDTLDVLGPLGKGFTVHKKAGARHILIAGGMGVAPLVSLCAKLAGLENRKPLATANKFNLSGSAKGGKIENREKITVLLGAATESAVLCEKEFESYGADVYVATDDGSEGFRGNAVQLLEKHLSSGLSVHPVFLYACGPEAMFKPLSRIIRDHPRMNAQASFEQFMGCGTGICRACVVCTCRGYARVCVDGPVFDLRDIDYE